MKKMSTLQKWWGRHVQTIIMVVIVILASVISFKLGEIKAFNDTKIDVTVRDIKNINPAQEKANTAIEALKRQGIDINKVGDVKKDVSKRASKDCVFVASRNSKKYHTKDCKYGKKIKESNLICFKSTEEAQQKGYSPAGGCFKKVTN